MRSQSNGCRGGGRSVRFSRKASSDNACQSVVRGRRGDPHSSARTPSRGKSDATRDCPPSGLASCEEGRAEDEIAFPAEP